MARTLRPAGMLHVLMVCARALVQVRGQRARRRCPRPRPRARARARPLRRPPRRPHAARTPPTDSPWTPLSPLLLPVPPPPTSVPPPSLAQPSPQLSPPSPPSGPPLPTPPVGCRGRRERTDASGALPGATLVAVRQRSGPCWPLSGRPRADRGPPAAPPRGDCTGAMRAASLYRAEPHLVSSRVCCKEGETRRNEFPVISTHPSRAHTTHTCEM
jgi:hypothetical protein